MRKKDETAKVLPLTPELEAYRKNLESKGLVVGPIEVALFQVQQKVTNGLLLSDALKEQPIFPRDFIAIIKVSEESNELALVFGKLEEKYNSEEVPYTGGKMRTDCYFEAADSMRFVHSLDYGKMLPV